MSGDSTFRQFDDGPTSPPWTEHLTDHGVPVDLSGADHCTIVAYQRSPTVPLFIDEVTPTNDDSTPTPVTCVVTHQWAEGELDVASRIRIEVVAVWPDTSPTTFPLRGYFAADVEAAVRQDADVT